MGKMAFLSLVFSLLLMGVPNASTGEWSQLAKRNRYLIPAGYAGWLCLSHRVGDGAELPMADGFRLVQFSSSGVVMTSSDGMPGNYFDEYFFVNPDGQLRPVGEQELGGGYTVTPPGKPEGYTYKFWVAADVLRDYSLLVDNKSRECGPFPGYSVP